MKLNKIAEFLFKTGRNFIASAFESFDEINSNTTIKSIEKGGEKINFNEPLNVSDVKKLFDLEIDTDYFNPVYLKEKLGLEIKDKGFIDLLKQSKESFKSFTEILDNIKSEMIDDVIVLPDSVNSDNIILKKAVEQIQEMIGNKMEKIPVVGLVSKLNEYKEQLNTTIEVSKKTIEILQGNTLLDKNILDVKEDMRAAVIKRKEELILKSQHLLKDMSALTKGLDDMLNYIEKGQDFDRMFDNSLQTDIHLNNYR